MDLFDIEKINKEMALLACTINGSIYNHRLFDESIVAILLSSFLSIVGENWIWKRISPSAPLQQQEI